MRLTIEELIDLWQDVLDSAEPGEYEVKNLVSEFLEDLHSLERN